MKPEDVPDELLIAVLAAYFDGGTDLGDFDPDEVTRFREIVAVTLKHAEITLYARLVEQHMAEREAEIRADERAKVAEEQRNIAARNMRIARGQETWVDTPAPGGYVCAHPATGRDGITLPDGTRICGMPTESEPCPDHDQEDPT